MLFRESNARTQTFYFACPEVLITQVWDYNVRDTGMEYRSGCASTTMMNNADSVFEKLIVGDLVNYFNIRSKLFFKISLRCS